MGMIDRRWFLIYLVVAISAARYGLASQHHSAFVLDNGPEDLLIDELVRNWKLAGVHQQRQTNRELQLENDEDIQVEDDAIQSKAFKAARKQQSKPGHHPFAFRPGDDPIASRVFSSNNIRFSGQKEDTFDNFQAQAADIEKLQNGLTESYNGDVVVHASSTLREPVAHAIISSSEALVAGCTASAVAAIVALGVCFYRWQRRAKAAQDVEYPAYGITGPGPSQSGKSSLKSSPSSSTVPGGIAGWAAAKGPKLAASGDKKLAHSAHMFHFQHQKQQVIAMESHSACERRGSNSGGESDEDNEEGDYTVYECPGLAPTGEMEVKNPLFLDDPTPATPAAKRQSE
nr:EOG090X0B4J [Ilyocryptus agilis]